MSKPPSTTRLVWQWVVYFASLGFFGGAAWWLLYAYRPYSCSSPSIQTRQRVEEAAHWVLYAQPADCQRRRLLSEVERYGPEGALDAWQQPLWIHCPNGKLEIRSAGDDGQLDTEDDITAYRYPWDAAREARREKEEGPW
jgi:hypothetical protein